MTERARVLSGVEGFTLTELLIAIAVGMMVIGGLAGISAMAARSQARDYRHGIVGGQVSQLMRYLQRDLARARRVYVLEGGPGAYVVPASGALCIATCDPGGTDCLNPFGNPTLRYYYYCHTVATDADGRQVGEVYRDDTKTQTDSGSCPGYGACNSLSEKVALYIDSMTFTRRSNEYRWNSLDIQLNGSWLSQATNTYERVQLQSQVTWEENNASTPRGHGL